MINKTITKGKKLQGDVQDIINHYMEELKMVENTPRHFYSRDGGITTVTI